MLDKEILGVVATLIGLGGYLPYLWQIHKGLVKPHVFSWLIWGTLMMIGFAAQVTENAGPGAWLTGIGGLLSFVIAGYSFKNADKYITRSDILMFAAALAAIPLWMLTEDPLYAVLLITLIDSAGFYPSFRKAFHLPREEGVIMFTLNGLGFFVSLLALEQYSLTTYLYPLAIAVWNWLLVLMILARRGQGNR